MVAFGDLREPPSAHGPEARSHCQRDAVGIPLGLQKLGEKQPDARAKPSRPVKRRSFHSLRMRGRSSVLGSRPAFSVV